MISVGSEVQILPGPPLPGLPSNGGVAQLGEHLLCKQGVNGSIPFVSITVLVVIEWSSPPSPPACVSVWECAVRVAVDRPR